jgi:hypothetical protein
VLGARKLCLKVRFFDAVHLLVKKSWLGKIHVTVFSSFLSREPLKLLLLELHVAVAALAQGFFSLLVVGIV